MLRRRSFLAVLFIVLACLGRPGPAAAQDAGDAPILTGDGLYTQPWFLQSFLDLREDLDEAAAGGKRFAIIWELRGCPYCRQTHLVNFAQPEIRAYVRENFDILQLNIVGSRRVTDFDGEELEERALARKNGVRFTPTVQFFPETAPGTAPGTANGLDGAAGRGSEVSRMQGYFRPHHFLAMFEYVNQKAYEAGDFGAFLKGRVE